MEHTVDKVALRPSAGEGVVVVHSRARVELLLALTFSLKEPDTSKGEATSVRVCMYVCMYVVRQLKASAAESPWP